MHCLQIYSAGSSLPSLNSFLSFYSMIQSALVSIYLLGAIPSVKKRNPYEKERHRMGSKGVEKVSFEQGTGQVRTSKARDSAECVGKWQVALSG